MSFPLPAPATLLELIAFDARFGLRSATAVLRRELTVPELLRVVGALATRGSVDPLQGDDDKPEPWDATHDRLTRHQLRAVFRLDDATREGLDWSEDRRLALIGEVVAATGSKFISKNVPFPSVTQWRGASAQTRSTFARQLQGRLFNTIMAVRSTSAREVAFDVTSCRFVQLCRAHDRMHLAPLFCEADARFFRSGHASGIRLKRTKTIAGGDDICDFRFVWES